VTRQDFLEARPTELQFGIDPVNGIRELNVQRRKIFRRDVLAVGLFAEFDL
jgi:hypothetical protein